MDKGCGRLSVVTGAGSGVGEAIAKALSKRGIEIALLGRTKKPLERVQKEIEQAGGRSEVFVCDVSDMDQVESVRSQILAQLGQPDILINNAGLHCELVPIAETTPGSWVQTMNTNVMGTYLITRAFLPGMLENQWGRIINVSSAASLGKPNNVGSVYQLSKVALNHFTRQLAIETAGTGITANVIHPGEVKTKMWAHIKAEGENRLGEGRNALQWANMVDQSGGDPPEKAAALVLEILQPEYDQINGEFLWIENGIKAPMPSW